MANQTFSRFSRLGFLFTALAWGTLAVGGDMKYAAGFTPEKSEMTLGEPIYLDFNLTNTGSKAILMFVGGNQWDVHGGTYRIQVFDASGDKVPDEYGDGRFAGDTLIGISQIKPGEIFVDRLYLPKFIKFKQPGNYTVIASRRLGFGQSPWTNIWMHSGALNSGDGLNWVDDYLPSTPEGGFITGPMNDYFSSSSTSQTTNCFKLTVLPADKQRLLKRAQELLAKLNGIGARDLVARTNGPRALDKMDWETEMSAWHLGKDNLDLAWTVRVLSDIGDRRIIPELKQHLNDHSMKVSFASVKVLCALGEPLRAEWIVPIIKSRQWSLFDDPETFVAKHGGADAAHILNLCMEIDPSFDGSFPGIWNTRLTNIIKEIGSHDAHPR